MLEAMRGFLGENDMMAYLAVMAIRLIELHRVLKPTGSLYLHCDPTASHYLKILLDAVFGPRRFINELLWKRYGAHNDVGQGSKHYGRVHDNLLFYSKSENRIWNQQFSPLDPNYIESNYRLYDENKGERYTTTRMTGPGGADKGNPVFEWNGHTRAWRYSKDTFEKLENEGRIHYSSTGYPRKKLYLSESKGVPIQTIWADISSLSGAHRERLGYPTQKPVALLERIIAASSNEGDVVLDPFCGCGTTVHAAQKLNRKWIGIDVTHLAISLIERRLQDAFGKDCKFETFGIPKTIDAARNLAERDKNEFEKWAVTLIPDVQPYKAGKGADGGIDGIVYMRTEKNRTDKAIVEVKGGGISVDQIHKLKSVIEREKALCGLFVTLKKPTRPMVAEAAAAGFAETPFGRIPRIQILTIEGLLNHTEYARLPAIDSSVFKKAPKEKKDEQGSLDL